MNCGECVYWEAIGGEDIHGNCTAPLPDCFMLESDLCSTMILAIKDIDELRRKMPYYEGRTCPLFEGGIHSSFLINAPSLKG